MRPALGAAVHLCAAFAIRQSSWLSLTRSITCLSACAQRGRGRGGGGRGRGRGGDKGPGNGSFVTAEDKQNADFNEYYQAQGIVPEGEWGDFLACLQRPLPVTFRINGSGRFADILREKLQSDFFSHFQQGPMFVSASYSISLTRKEEASSSCA